MSEFKGSQLSDEELEQQGIQLPLGSTDADFYEWIDQMIEEVFADIPEEDKV